MSSKIKKRGIPRWLFLLVLLLAAGLLTTFVILMPFEWQRITDEKDVSELSSDIDEKPNLESDELELEQEEPIDDPEKREIPQATECQDDEKLNNIDVENDIHDEDQPDLKVIANGDFLLALVTKDTTLSEDYEPADLEPVPSYMNPSYNMYLREMALEMLRALWYQANEDGVILSIRSAYRSYATQERLFYDYASRHGEEEANRFSARPGQSEHQLGTTVDFGGTAADLTAAFAETEQGLWLADNAHRFGFALSYPEGKEQITGYIFEPWHYRYIGVEAAHAWKDSGLTLKEFLETKSQFYE